MVIFDVGWKSHVVTRGKKLCKNGVEEKKWDGLR